MNIKWLQDIIKDRVKVTEVLEYYDMPILFTCANKKGELFIGSACEDEKDHGVWIYAPTSQERLDDYLQNKIDLRDFYLNIECGAAIVLNYYGEKDKRNNAHYVKCDSIPENYLPAKGFFNNAAEEEEVKSENN